MKLFLLPVVSSLYIESMTEASHTKSLLENKARLSAAEAHMNKQGFCLNDGVIAIIVDLLGMTGGFLESREQSL